MVHFHCSFPSSGRERMLRAAPPRIAVLVAVPAIAWLLLASAPSLAQTSPKPFVSRLILLEGSSVPFQSLEIAAEKLTVNGVPANLTIDELQGMEIAMLGPNAGKAAVVAELRSGGRVFATGALIGNDKCQLARAGSEALSLPLDLVRALRLDPATASPNFDKAIAAPSIQWDRVFLKDDTGNLSSASGLVESLTEQQLSLEISGKKTSVPRQRLYGLVVSQSAATDPPPRCLVVFTDGSQLAGQTLVLADGNATIGFSAGGQAKFTWNGVARVRIRSSRVAYLSELEPVVEQQQPIVTSPQPAQRDKSVTGGPLRLGTQSFEKGIGVHARSRLTFAADGKWDTFIATIGLDAATGGQGDCIFKVLADGQPLVSRRMRGSDEPYEIQASITGREQLTLLVEPGEGLDLADHANWCDARLIKKKP